ncbi:hypothetical protein HU200_018200 [Digitaria exilis]|uniref:Retrotransposon gag domain-containing protein n=1 Tax=Digitaria exilis TaxID=1010633 RepID=A0A835F5I0_9POAL|nr:hypothetical protein HU200_018200 [Digitaria exilis]
MDWAGTMKPSTGTCFPLMQIWRRESQLAGQRTIPGHGQASHWQRLPENTLKVNVDGAFFPSDGSGAIGAVARDAAGAFLMATTRRLPAKQRLSVRVCNLYTREATSANELSPALRPNKRPTTTTPLTTGSFISARGSRVPLTLKRASPSRSRPAVLEGRRTGNSARGPATHSFHDMIARLCGQKEESLHYATIPRRGEDTGQIRSPQSLCARRCYCANYSMTLSVPDTPQAPGKHPRRTTGRARHHPHPRVTSLEATPELEGAIPARIVHGVGSTVHLATFSPSPALLVLPYYEQHETRCYAPLLDVRPRGQNQDKPLRPEFTTLISPSERVVGSAITSRGLRCATSASFPMGDFDHRRFPERSSDPFPAGYEIWFGSLQFHATGNGYLMRILSKEPSNHPEAPQPPAAAPRQRRRPRPRTRRARRKACRQRHPSRKGWRCPTTDAKGGGNAFSPDGHAPPNLYGLRNNAAVYASSVNTNISAYDDLPGHHLASVRNLIASTPDDSYPESGEEYALGQEFPGWDYSGLRDREAFLDFQDVADYFFGYSDDEYDPTRECFAIDGERVNDGHTTDDDDDEDADPVGAQPPDLQDRSPQGDEPRSHHQAQDTHANELGDRDEQTPPLMRSGRVPPDENTGCDADARQAGRLTRARILNDGENDDPVTLPRTSQKLIAAAALLRAMPQPTIPEARKLHREAQTLVENAARQQAESSASRLPWQGVLGALPSAKQRDTTIARRRPTPHRRTTHSSNGGARHEDPCEISSPGHSWRLGRRGGNRRKRGLANHDTTTSATTIRTVTGRRSRRSIRMAPIPPRFRQPTTITKYSGETDPRMWLNDYRLACQLGGVTDDVMIIRNLPLHLADSARTWLEHLPPNRIHDWNDLVETFVGNSQGTYVRPRNTWDLRGCKQKPGESLRDFIRRFSKRCTKLPNITDAQIIHSFLESTTSYNLICKLGRNPPPDANRLFEVASKYASGEEEANAIFNGKKGKHPDQGTPRRSKVKARRGRTTTNEVPAVDPSHNGPRGPPRLPSPLVYKRGGKPIFSPSPALLVLPYYEQHETRCYAPLLDDKPLRPEFITLIPPSERVFGTRVRCDGPAPQEPNMHHQGRADIHGRRPLGPHVRARRC